MRDVGSSGCAGRGRVRMVDISPRTSQVGLGELLLDEKTGMSGLARENMKGEFQGSQVVESGSPHQSKLGSIK